MFLRVMPAIVATLPERRIKNDEMRVSCFFCFFFLFCATGLWAQRTATLTGEVSFVSSRNVYVKFISTENINPGDTLMASGNGAEIPALLVTNKSSTSVVTTLLEGVDIAFTPGQAITFYYEEPVPIAEAPNQELPADNISNELAPDEDQQLLQEAEQDEAVEAEVRGRISAGSYSNFNTYRESHRFRYAMVLGGNDLADGRLSFDAYTTFRYAPDRWSLVEENLFNALKIYNLSLGYEVTPTARVSLGRRINRKFSNMGAVDGLQLEKDFGNFTLGAIVGSRPDVGTYGVNPDLFEYGLFSSYQKNQNYTTLAFVEQKNKQFTDRRFVFLQHSGNLTEQLFLLASFQIDLYENINEVVNHQPHLTNFFISTNYRLSRKLRFSAAYDNRKNIIFYESYKNYIDQLIDEETRQGLRLGVQARPFDKVNVGSNFNWRFQKSGTNDAKNANIFINFAALWSEGSSLSLRGTWLQTSYLQSYLLGLRVRQTIIARRLDGDAYFRRVDYRYQTTGLTSLQYLLGVNLNLRLTDQLSLYLYGEATYQQSSQEIENRINTRIIKRF